MKALIRRVFSEKAGERSLAILFLLILGTILVPLFLLTRYAIPYFDDYNYALPVWLSYKWGGYTLKAAIVGAVKNAMEMRYAWQGTYGSIFLMGLIPLIFGEKYYFLGPVFLLSLLTVSLFLCLGLLSRRVFRGSFWTTLGLQAGMTVIVLLLMYSPQQGIYWYNGGVHYFGMFSFELLYFSLLIALLTDHHRIRNGIGIALSIPLGFFVAGANFITALQVPILLCSAIAFSLIRKNRRILLWLPSFVAFGIGFFLNVSASGNSIRAAYYVGRAMSPGKAILYSFRDALTFGREFANWRTILLFLLLAPVVYQLVEGAALRIPLWSVPVVFLWSFCVYAATCTPGLYGTGANDLSRTINVIQITFQLMLLTDMGCLFGALRGSFEKFPKIALPWALLILWLLAWGWFFRISPDQAGQYSAYGAHYYLKTGEAKQFHREYEERLSLLKTGESEVVLSPYSVRPWFLIWDDLSEDPGAEANRAISSYYGKQSVVVR